MGSKEENDASYRPLNKFLDRPETVEDLGKYCIKAVSFFQDHLRTRENTLGNHVRMDISNCNRVCTSSPSESMNSCLKEGPSKSNNNMNLNKSTQQMMVGINTRGVIA